MYRFIKLNLLVAAYSLKDKLSGNCYKVVNILLLYIKYQLLANSCLLALYQHL